jgi:ATP/maltotriose-dependent transcriptional regulator MalT
VHGDIGFIETPELLFTEAETAALAQTERRRRPAMPRREIAAIHAATNGWPAGVSLLLSSRSSPSAPRFVAGSDEQPIFDYLASAVFGPLSPSEQRLLLYTGCLQRFTPSQAETLSGVAGARSALIAFYRGGLFLEREDTETEVFRWHALFRAFLLHQAAQSLGASELRAMRVAAARLLREEGHFEEAFDLLVQANDVDGLQEIVLAAAPAHFAQGRVALLERWLEALPEPLVRQSAWLEYWRSMCLLTTAPADARSGLERALAMFEQQADGTGAYLAWAGAVQAQAYEALAWQKFDGWLERLEHLQRTCPPFQSADIAVHVASSLGILRQRSELPCIRCCPRRDVGSRLASR